MRCEETNINYGETCSHQATWLLESPRLGTRYYCTRHAPKKNRYCHPLKPQRLIGHKSNCAKPLGTGPCDCGGVYR